MYKKWTNAENAKKTLFLMGRKGPLEVNKM